MGHDDGFVRSRDTPYPNGDSLATILSAGLRSPIAGQLDGFIVRRDDDPGACLGVGPGVVMHEPDPQPSADGRQVVRLLTPVPPGELDGTEERQLRDAQSAGRAAGGQDPPVKWGVVGHQNGCPVQERGQAVPGLREPRCILDHLPGDPVDVGKQDSGPRRPDQEGLTVDDRHGFDPDQTDRAGAIRLVVGGLEVDGHERPVRRRECGRPRWVAWKHGGSVPVSLECFPSLIHVQQAERPEYPVPCRCNQDDLVFTPAPEAAHNVLLYSITICCINEEGGVVWRSSDPGLDTARKVACSRDVRNHSSSGIWART